MTAILRLPSKQHLPTVVLVNLVWNLALLAGSLVLAYRILRGDVTSLRDLGQTVQGFLGIVALSTPAIATLTVFSFPYAWNSFVWPLIIIGEGNEANHVLTLSLIRLSNIADEQPNLVLTGAAVAILPPVIVFIMAQRYFIEGIATSGLKG